MEKHSTQGDERDEAGYCPHACSLHPDVWASLDHSLLGLAAGETKKKR
jgi:hypothetical protein